ncbi:MAG: hypothetical protein A2065_02330 [Alphaproteobacteria bacterium GWB1_45_5]|nr:MAG: hypothetical protein A2065_02330 [Alphaproteobacteria bacterium GWB1_45_5]
MVKISDLKTREPSPDLSKKDQSDGRQVTPNILNQDLYTVIRNMEIDALRSFKNQARQNFDQEALEELAKTIKEHGVRQPLTVIESASEPGVFEVLSGERRLRAAKLAGLTRVPCIVVDDALQAEEIALIENIQREDLHPIELGQAYFKLLKAGICHSQEEIAKKVGVKQSQVSEYIKYAKLPPEIVQQVVTHKLTRRAFLRNLLKTYTVEDMKLYVSAELHKQDSRYPKVPIHQRGSRNLLTLWSKDGLIKMNAAGFHEATEEEKELALKSLKEIIHELETSET